MRPERALLVSPMVLLLASAAFGANVEITSPASGARLAALITVTATLDAAPGEDLTPPVVQTIDGRRIPMVLESPGVYTAQVDTTTLPNGHQSLLVFVTPKGVEAERRDDYADSSWGADKQISVAEARVVVRNPYNFYWGDLHAHSTYSDGAWYPKELYEFARDEAKLDFFAVTDHAEILTVEEYADVVTQADAADEPGRFVALYGVERSNPNTGHVNFYMSPIHVLPYDLNDFYRTLNEMDLVGHFNHPWKRHPEESWRNDFQGFRHAPEGDSCMAMVELRSEGEEQCYIAMLDTGWHVGAAGCEDKHSPEWGQGPTWTVALARELTRESVLEAMRARRTYSTADRNMKLEFTLDGEDMGARISRPAGEYKFSVFVDDRDEADLVEQVDVFLDGRIAAKMGSEPATRVAFGGPLIFPAGNHYCFVRVTQPEGRTTWSSPIWVSAYEYSPEAEPGR